MRPTEDGYQRTNREQTREPRSKAHWCWGCDGQKVADGQRCNVCGTVDGKKRAKRGKPLVRD